MAHRVQWRTQNCPECGTRLPKVAAGLTGAVEIGSPLVVCKKCGKTSYTKMRKEWYNYPNKDLLWTMLLPLAVGIGIMIWGEHGLLDIVLGVMLLVVTVACGIVEAVRIAQSKRRMRDPEYLAELLRWRIIRQEEYEAFMRDAQQ